jgi:hypothetical protein
LEKFIARYGAAVTAVFRRFDRLVFRGTLLPLVWERGIHTFLARAGVRLLDFRQYALRTTEQLITRSVQEALRSAPPDSCASPFRNLGGHDSISRALSCDRRVLDKRAVARAVAHHKPWQLASAPEGRSRNSANPDEK